MKYVLFLPVWMVLISLSTGCGNKSVSSASGTGDGFPSRYSNLSSQELNQEGLKIHKTGAYSGPDGSASLFRYARMKDSNNYAAWFNEACALSLASNVNGSASALSRAIEINPVWVLPRVNDPDLAFLLSSSAGIKDLLGQYDGSSGENSPVGFTVVKASTGPDDTLEAEVLLEKNGLLSGTASMSGATGIFTFKSGRWSIVGGKSVVIRLTLEGEVMGKPKNETAGITVALEDMFRERKLGKNKIEL